ncbi:cyclin dependent kinase inhibitor 1Bb [Brachyhypopomus gauderio]|uniref:cyclin dependent kinase inhibitor 1Bb n=1 Tax=Brachyhypopomus gauderio TaxID=698409 RepID=UPI0040424CE6
MSDVRLSNGSPTLGRMDARSSEQPKPSACRCLFGSVDHEELRKELKGHLKVMEEASSDTWDFNFSTFTPRPTGRYRWKAVDSTDLPSFYSAPGPRSRDGRSSGNNSVDVNGNHDRVAVTPCRLVEEKTERCESQVEKREPHVKGQRKRAPCLDSSCQAKRPRTCLDEVTRLTQTDLTPQKSSPATHT